MKKLTNWSIVLFFSAFMLLQVAHAQSTELTFQGQLQNSSAPANGNFDFEFLLFDAVAGGTQIGSTIQRNGVAVASGVFSVNLDFGSSFPGASRFLEIRVKEAGGAAFTTLSPRQPVKSAPYSIKSLTSDTATTATNATTAATATNATTAGAATNFTGNLAGDVTGTQGATTVGRLQNRVVSSTPPLDGQVLKYNGVSNQWVPGTDNAGTDGGGGTITGVTPGTGLTGGGATGNVTLGVANGGIGTPQLAAGSVTDAKIAAVSGAKVTGAVANATAAVNATNATTATTANSATNFTGNLAGDVTGTQAATVVNTVGGQSAANVSSAAQAVAAATANNTPNTLVRRDGSGNFAAGTITGNLAGNATTATTATNATNATNAVTATNFTGNLAGDVTGTQSATVVSSVGGQTAANVASAAQAINTATANSTPNTLVRRDGSGNFVAGTITGNLAGNATTATTATNATNATNATTAVNATNFTGNLAGDVTGPQGNTVVSTFGGMTTATVSNAVQTISNATPNNTANSIVRRNDFGNFAVGTITGNLTGNASTATNATQLGGVVASQYVLTGDARLSDARTPLAGSTSYIQNQNAGPQSASNFNISGNGTAGGTLSGNIVNASTHFGLASGRVLSTPGNGNIFTGIGAGGANTPGSNNSFFGNNSGFLNSGGFSNSFFGSSAGESNLGGNSNSFFGRFAGYQNQTGSNNSSIGAGSGPGVGLNNLNYATAIGAGAIVSTSNTIVLGRGLLDDVIAANRLRVNSIPLQASLFNVCFNSSGDLLQCGASSLRWKSNVQPFSDGINVLRQFRPISYDWKDGGGHDIGLAAEEVDKVAPFFAFRNKEGVVEGVRYERLNMLLINAVNDQQDQIEKLRAENAALNERLRSLEKSVDAIVKKLDRPR